MEKKQSEQKPLRYKEYFSLLSKLQNQPLLQPKPLYSELFLTKTLVSQKILKNPPFQDFSTLKTCSVLDAVNKEAFLDLPPQNFPPPFNQTLSLSQPYPSKPSSLFFDYKQNRLSPSSLPSTSKAIHYPDSRSFLLQASKSTAKHMLPELISDSLLPLASTIESNSQLVPQTNLPPSLLTNHHVFQTPSAKLKPVLNSSLEKSQLILFSADTESSYLSSSSSPILTNCTYATSENSPPSQSISSSSVNNSFTFFQELLLDLDTCLIPKNLYSILLEKNSLVVLIRLMTGISEKFDGISSFSSKDDYTTHSSFDHWVIARKLEHRNKSLRLTSTELKIAYNSVQVLTNLDFDSLNLLKDNLSLIIYSLFEVFTFKARGSFYHFSALFDFLLTVFPLEISHTVLYTPNSSSLALPYPHCISDLNIFHYVPSKPLVALMFPFLSESPIQSSFQKVVFTIWTADEFRVLHISPTDVVLPSNAILNLSKHSSSIFNPKNSKKSSERFHTLSDLGFWSHILSLIQDPDPIVVKNTTNFVINIINDYSNYVGVDALFQPLINGDHIIQKMGQLIVGDSLIGYQATAAIKILYSLLKKSSNLYSRLVRDRQNHIKVEPSTWSSPFLLHIGASIRLQLETFVPGLFATLSNLHGDTDLTSNATFARRISVSFSAHDITTNKLTTSKPNESATPEINSSKHMTNLAFPSNKIKNFDKFSGSQNSQFIGSYWSNHDFIDGLHDIPVSSPSVSPSSTLSASSISDRRESSETFPIDSSDTNSSNINPNSNIQLKPFSKLSEVRVMLLSIILHILNESEDPDEILGWVDLRVWDCLVYWVFQHPSNSNYQSIFYQLLSLVIQSSIYLHNQLFSNIPLESLTNPNISSHKCTCSLNNISGCLGCYYRSALSCNCDRVLSYLIESIKLPERIFCAIKSLFFYENCLGYFYLILNSLRLVIQTDRIQARTYALLQNPESNIIGALIDEYPDKDLYLGIFYLFFGITLDNSLNFDRKKSLKLKEDLYLNQKKPETFHYQVNSNNKLFLNEANKFTSPASSSESIPIDLANLNLKNNHQTTDNEDHKQQDTINVLNSLSVNYKSKNTDKIKSIGLNKKKSLKNSSKLSKKSSLNKNQKAVFDTVLESDLNAESNQATPDVLHIKNSENITYLEKNFKDTKTSSDALKSQKFPDKDISRTEPPINILSSSSKKNNTSSNIKVEKAPEINYFNKSELELSNLHNFINTGNKINIQSLLNCPDSPPLTGTENYIQRWQASLLNNPIWFENISLIRKHAIDISKTCSKYKLCDQNKNEIRTLSKQPIFHYSPLAVKLPKVFENSEVKNKRASQRIQMLTNKNTPKQPLAKSSSHLKLNYAGITKSCSKTIDSISFSKNGRDNNSKEVQNKASKDQSLLITLDPKTDIFNNKSLQKLAEDYGNTGTNTEKHNDITSKLKSKKKNRLSLYNVNDLQELNNNNFTILNSGIDYGSIYSFCLGFGLELFNNEKKSHNNSLESNHLESKNMDFVKKTNSSSIKKSRKKKPHTSLLSSTSCLSRNKSINASEPNKKKL
ncbi:hypothetical protein BB561_004388 [Smittium simulii]|uniref:Uncharacterized protein n=1 Tax=Smittium simulii TaxID=133385 RepID=A0A2T9YGK1_9FUNG|nr:hypothetical protein BB561_004388 [Smittium simulii]